MHAGGCECGFVRYRLVSDPIFVNCCHCGMCQRASGSAFAINAMIEADRVEVTSEGVPETVVTETGAKGERCPRCGIELWAYHRMFGDGLRFVRVGTLDESGSVEPDAHFFVSRKRPWVQVPAGAPSFAELPGEGEEGWPPEVQSRVRAAVEG